MAEKLAVTSRTIEREKKKLREFGHVICVGGKRYGHWEVMKVLGKTEWQRAIRFMIFV